MNRRPSIASVTVAYNGAAVLQNHLNSLRAQARALDEIIVVDNASTDETRTLLSNRFPEVTLLQLPENLGVAGGLAAGLSYAAREKKYDWVWTFDQDSVPAPDCLENLLLGLDSLSDDEKTAILAPVCLNQETSMWYPGLSWRGPRFVPTAVDPARPVTFVDMVISSGSLIRSEAIAAVGLPDRDLFIDFVDYEYCLRFQQSGYRIGVVRDSRLEHAIGTPATFNFLGRARSWADHAPWREYYMARNEVFTIWKYRPATATKMFVLYRLAQHALGILLFGKNKLECFRMMRRGLRDGFAGRLGIRVLPGSGQLAEQQTAPVSPTQGRFREDAL